MYKLLEHTNISEDMQISISLEERYVNILEKTASLKDFPEEVDFAIKNMKRKKDHSYVLVTAMGDGETWGANRNGDYFPYDSLLGIQNTKVWNEEAGKDERLDINKIPVRRYETFNDANFYKHHKNKPERGDPDFGYVEKSIWNPKMRTVLLIIGVDRIKDPETAGMIDANQLISVSMGAKLPWDRCSICGSKHKTLREYCNHLKYNLGKILPSGKRVYAENLFPRFFDISRVGKPAFLAGMQLEKIAKFQGGDLTSLDLAEYYDIGRFDKLAETEKISTLYKQIPVHIEGAIAKVSQTEMDLPHKLLEDLGKMEPKEAWGTLTHAGIIAKPNEFAYIILYNSGHYELANKFINTKAIIGKPDVKGLDEKLHDLSEIDINYKAKKISKNIPDNVMEERSIGSLSQRIYETEKGLRKHADVKRTIALGSILSALYLLYRSNAESIFSAYGLLGAGIGQLMLPDHNVDKYVGNNPNITEQLNKHASSFWDSGKGTLLKGAAGFATPYILSAHYQNEIANGGNVGIIGKTIANNPGKLGIVGAAAMMSRPGTIKNILSTSKK